MNVAVGITRGVAVAAPLSLSLPSFELSQFPTTMAAASNATSNPIQTSIPFSFLIMQFPFSAIIPAKAGTYPFAALPAQAGMNDRRNALSASRSPRTTRESRPG